MAISLVMCDGGVSGLIACAAAGVRAATGPASEVFRVFPYGPTEFHEQAARSQASDFGLELLSDRAPLRQAHIPDGEGEVRALLEASWALRGLGGGEVIWPVTFETLESGQNVAAAADALSACVLVSQLATLDFGRGDSSAVFKVRAPYSDLTERQLADLVLDMDLPIWLCWWMAASKYGEGLVKDRALRERDRWASILKQAGWAGSLEAKAEVSVRSGVLGPVGKSHSKTLGDKA